MSPKTKRPPPRPREADPGPVASFALPVDLARKLLYAWARWEEREELRMDPHKQVEFRIERQIVASIGALLAAPSRVAGYDQAGRSRECLPIVGSALCWLKISNWCCREAWNTKNPRELRNFHGSLGLLVTSTISPLILVGRGYADEESEESEAA
jgi:hypothetical protein